MKRIGFFLALLIVFSLFSLDVQAQCAMCKEVAQDASDQSGNAVGLGLNNGIKYLLIIPYILFGVFLTIFFRRRK
ncbi:MAG: hypothetical protein AB8B53_12945 [Flavobacteriales bacterium]